MIYLDKYSMSSCNTITLVNIIVILLNYTFKMSLVLTSDTLTKRELYQTIHSIYNILRRHVIHIYLLELIFRLIII